MSLPLSQLQNHQQQTNQLVGENAFGQFDASNSIGMNQQVMSTGTMGMGQRLAGTPGGGVPHRELYRKTRMCKYFLQGYCVHGDQCDHAHDVSELRHLPDMRSGGYAHGGNGRQMLDTAPTSPGSTESHPNGTGDAGSSHEREVFRKTRMCKYFQQGYCVHGSDCNYAHDWSEIRHIPGLHTGKANEYSDVDFKEAQFMNAAGGGQKVQYTGDSAAATNAAVLAALSNTAAALNQNPSLLVTAPDSSPSLLTSQKAMSNTMTADDFLEQAQLLDQIAKALEQLNGSADSSAFTAGDEVRLRLRSYTGGQDMIAALVDEPPDNFPSITDSFPTIPAPSLDADAPAFVPQQPQSALTSPSASSTNMNSHYTKSSAGTLLVPPSNEPASESRQSRPRGLSGWKPLESIDNSESRSRTLSQIATILEARRRLPSFSPPPSPPATTPSSSEFGAAVGSPTHLNDI
ncbi:hypothetical protein Pmar_PMAR000823 [Perkinsus marinus ATCC 50983]|uniref:C3H1-type domain-containing protein n=1 Tax=Perkinsus marinus (strain ATCC 50983 / TXsc) TaxID=423536 RepID=C5KXQ5_PERM5|nr:hypothetical protein Pmar_PMAR000823 [Perkinsus marinus ATCC 50983]EER10779.1 hypothetical protein Pmar_PMAR000823 [Perkinsus marinus ATCC 50983]|eukprot:XP_002778984.1 hypothetical protein Pmar_PMAR000823 [Perkinsus marinus ATCC 50983]